MGAVTWLLIQADVDEVQARNREAHGKERRGILGRGMTQPLGGPAPPLEGAPRCLREGLTASFLYHVFFFKLHQSLQPALRIADGAPFLTCSS